MEITQAQFEEYVSLQSENKKMKEDAENTAKAFKTYREDIKNLKEELSSKDNAISEKEKELSEKEAALEDKEKEITEAKEIADKWTSYEEKTKQERLDKIEKMKTDLGEKFDDNVKNFIDWLPEEKVENYLSNLMPKDEKAKPITDWGQGWDTPSSQEPNSVNTNIESWNINEAIKGINFKK